MKGVWYFNGESLIINDTGCPKDKFWLTCANSFFYLLINTNFDFEFLEKAEIVIHEFNPIISTYYIECDEKSLEDLLNKYCTKDARSSLMSDWDLYGSEPGKVQKRLHVFQFDDGDILFSRSEESNDRFYLSAPDHFWKEMASRHHYKELEMREEDRFKNRDNFKLIEINEYEMIKIFSDIVDRKHIEEFIERLFEECNKWTETR